MAEDCFDGGDNDHKPRRIKTRSKPRKHALKKHASINASISAIRRLHQLRDLQIPNPLYEGIKKLADQRWKTLILRWDYGAIRPHPIRRFVYNEESKLSRWDVIHILLHLAFCHQKCVETFGSTYDMTWSRSCKREQIHIRVLPVLEAVGKMGEETANNYLLVKDYEIEGIVEIFQVKEIVPQEHLAEDMEHPFEEGYPLRIW